jgi:hypothetical protein
VFNCPQQREQPAKLDLATNAIGAQPTLQTEQNGQHDVVSTRPTPPESILCSHTTRPRTESRTSAAQATHELASTGSCSCEDKLIREDKLICGQQQQGQSASLYPNVHM